MSVEANYLRDLGHLLRELAMEAKRAAATTAGENNAYEQGRLMAFHEVISLMQEQARAFQLSLDRLSLEGIDPEGDLL